MKRVRCLYRVSTVKQLDKNDIPMQRIECMNFIKTMLDWELDKEYIEKGVSGYNKRLEDRDVLQEIRKDALNKEFDVLLVFMFDRLGRRDDETPFVVEWFYDHGIEIWSTQEGRQRFDERTDKLTNYMRYWMSAGESEKTSMRVRAKQRQMIEDGINITSVPPYGYKMVKTGILTKRGVERKTYQIVATEAEIVKKIFNLFTEEGYGGIRIAKYLNERGYKTHKGLEWSYSTINNMLRNPIYKGYLCFHKTSVPKGGGKRKRVVNKDEWIYSKEKIPEFVIISEEQFEKAQKIKLARKNKNKECEAANKEYFKYQTKGEMLFTGYIFCGGCGSKLVTRSSKRNIKLPDGSSGFTKYSYYACMNSSNGRKCDCKKKSHKNNTIEEPVLQEIYKYFDLLETRDLSDYVRKIHRKTKDIEGAQIRELEKNIKEANRENELLKKEVIKVITGKSTFSKEMLSELIEDNNKKSEEFQKQKTELEIIKKQKEIEFEQMLKVKKMIPNWKEILKNASIEKKKMILASIIKKIVVYDEKIDIHLKINFDEFIKTAKKLDVDVKKNCFENVSNRGANFSNTNVGSF